MVLTPLRRQYLRIKQRYPEVIVFFRLGDFYETFDRDAEVTSRELEIVLTSREMGRGQRVPMAGIPYHALDNYLARLIKKGYKVAICEQLTPPGKGLVEREVIRVVTPGTVVEPGLLESKANNYLVSLVVAGNDAGFAYADVSTSEFATGQFPADYILSELERLQPAEILLLQNAQLAISPQGIISGTVTPLEDFYFDLEFASQSLLEHFGTVTLEGYGCASLPLAIRAAGALVQYLKETQKGALNQLTRLTTYSPQPYMVIDPQTRRNLELFQSSRSGVVGGSLLSVLDLARTAMGGRLLRNWLGQPLLDIAKLNQRQETVAWFHSNAMVRSKIISLLKDIADLERLVNRIKGHYAGPRELISFYHSLEKVPQIKELIDGVDSLAWLLKELRPFRDITELIKKAISEEPPAKLETGGLIKAGFSAELDNLRATCKKAKEYIANLESQERQRTGIKSLKVGYNKVFGYYIEVSKPNLRQVPQDYIRKQTLVGAERFFTPELKEYESLILNAQERIGELEVQIFRRVCQQVGERSEDVLATAKALAHLDVFTSLAEVAARYGYVKPRLNNEDEIIIKGGRHPVVERSLGNGGFISNDTYLSTKDSQIIIVTGPNMSGKSTYLRQVALIVLLAQIGSFVPADSATIGVVDRIFTRIGAQDDLVTGRSTFMVEMVETANILNNATSRSLIILDEIGRGTSTYDGLAIAQAVVEFLHNHPKLEAKTLFATHYHELVELANFLPRVKNFNVAVSEEGGKIIFLYKVVPGGADKSYGIHVAQLAGLPKAVVRRAQEILAGFENGRYQRGWYRPVRVKKTPPEQLPLFGQKSTVVEKILKLDIEAMTPLEALTKLYELQKEAKEQKL